MSFEDQVNAAINEAFAEVIAVVNEEFDAVISSEDEFGDLGFVGQDIIDTGRLLNSKQVNVENGRAEWSWNPTSPDTGVPYAAAVRNGFFAFGRKYIPGRHWDTRAIKRADPVSLLVDELEKRGIDAKVKQNNIDLLD